MSGASREGIDYLVATVESEQANQLENGMTAKLHFWKDDYPSTMDSKLARLKRRGELWDYSIVTFMLLFIICVTVFLIVTEKFSVNPAVNVILAVPFGIFYGWIVMQGINNLDRFVRRRWVTSYYIEESPDVIKVIGSIPANDWGWVKSRLTRLQPSFRIIDDAPERFGCLMAAVPASDSFLAARHELGAKGLDI